MSTFLAELIIDGVALPVMSCEYSFEQPVDSRGKAVTGVKGGIIYIQVEAGADETLLNWAADPVKKLDGNLQFYRIDQHSRYKEIRFLDAYCFSYEEQFDPGDSKVAYYCRIGISARAIQVGKALHDNLWPV